MGHDFVDPDDQEDYGQGQKDHIQEFHYRGRYSFSSTSKSPVGLVIFGAGASFDSAQAYRLKIVGGVVQDDGLVWRPPLADGLFSDPHGAFGTFVKRYPKIRAVLPLLRERSNKSVEAVLESLQNEESEYAERHRQLAAVRFYLRDLLAECTSQWLDRTNGVTNYESLIDQILRRHRTNEDICLVTFNYDSLLEHALCNFGFQPREPIHFLAC